MSMDSQPSTLVIKTALVRLDGPDAGQIQVPITLGDSPTGRFDFGGFSLQVPREERLLQPAGREVSGDRVTLMFYSKHIRQSKQLPTTVTLHWGEINKRHQCGMEISCHEAP